MKPSFWQKPPPLNWRAYPLPPLAICCGFGIMVADHVGYRPLPLLLPVLAISTLLMGYSAYQKYRKQGVRSGLSLAILLLVVGFGMWRAIDDHLPNRNDFFALTSEASSSLDATEETVTIPTGLHVSVNTIRPGEKSLRLTTTVLGRVDTRGVQLTSGRLLLYLPPTSRAAELEVGDELYVNGAFRPIGPPLNPHAFDAENYWSHQSVYHRMFLRNDEQWLLFRSNTNGLRAYAESIRQRWLSSFRPYLNGDRLAVAAALVLGKKDLLSKDIRSAYADTGAVHVLAVSGLHVGIIAGIIVFFLRWTLPRRRWTRSVRTLLAVVGIWTFAFITGLSPSVQRSATMFTILLLGTLWRRKTYLINTLGGAALLMLIWNPQQLFQVGFQLSFAAVLGIGLFLRPLQKALFFRRKWLRGIWAVLSVSLAAQLGTLPLSIYYFHQFPLYFLLSGSIVILTAHAALAGGLLHGLVAWLIPVLKPVTAALLGGVVEVQNLIVYWSRKLPGARQDFDWILPWEVSLLIASIGCFAAWVKWRSFPFLMGGILPVLLFLLFRLQSSKAQSEQQGFVIYHQPKATLIDVVSGDRGVGINSPDLNPISLQYTADNHRQAIGFSPDTTWLLAPRYTIDSLAGIAYRAGDYLDVPSKRWLVFDGEHPILRPPVSPPEALLLINNASYFEVSKLLQLDQIPLIVLDGSHRNYILNEWEEKRSELPGQLVITGTNGAYVDD